jgi:peptidoglycan biosynthesis protein MviN/MurJ (putative lipid II flippase)
MVGLNFVLMVVFVNVLPEPQERGVALATAICAVIQSAWLARRLARRVGQVHWVGLGAFVVRVSVAAAAMAAACWSIEGFLGTHRSVRVLGLLAIGTAAFFAASWLMGIPELKELLHLKRRAQPAGS